MKVLHVINNLETGGAENLVLQLIAEMNSVPGVEVQIVTLYDTRRPLPDYAKEMEIRSLSAKNKYSRNIIYGLRQMFASFDIVHVHLFPSLYYAAWASRTMTSAPRMIFTEHSIYNRRLRKVLRPLERRVYRHYDWITCVSDEIRLTMVEHLGSAMSGSLIHIPNGIDRLRFAEALPYDRETFFPKGSQILIQVARLNYPKDHITVVRSLRFLPPNYRLLIAGDGPQRSDIEAVIKSEGMGDRVLLLGNRDDIHRLMATADIGILSSAYEGHSLCAQEMMASGLPVVASRVKGLTELCHDVGRLFPLGNARGLAHEVMQYQDEQVRKQSIRLGRQKTQSSTLSHTIKEYLSLYRSL